MAKFSSMVRYAKFALAALLLPHVSLAEPFLHPWENHHQDRDTLGLNAELSYFSTATNFDSTGVLFTPNGLAKYSRIGTDVTAAYGLSPQLTLFGRLSWSRLELDHASRPGTGFGLGDQAAGMNWRIFEGKKSDSNGFGFTWGGLELQAQIDLPAYDNAVADADQTPRLGDQSVDVSAGGFLTVRLLQSRRANLNLVGGLGYLYRSQSFSAGVPWSAALRYEPRQQGFRGNLTLYGVQSLSTDPRGDDITLLNNTSVAAGTGGSYMTGAINPSFFSLKAEAGYESREGLAFSGGLIQSVFGKSAPSGMAVLFSLQKRFGASGGAALRESKPEQLSPVDYGKSNQGFVNYAFEAKVLKSNDRLNLVKIDKGSQDGVEKGQYFDIFSLKSDGSVGEPVARTRVAEVRGNEAILSITEYYKEVWIEEGFVAKRPLQ